jgi:hypothetical protein
MEPTLGDYLEAISSGKADGILDQLSYSISSRRKVIALTAGHQLRPGDRVVFTGGRPRYLIGVEATVKQVKQSYVLVTLDSPVGKFHREINAPMSLIRKVDHGKE